VIYRTVIWKNPSEVITPDNVDRATFETQATSDRDDFENNYKSQVTVINSPIAFDSEISYTDFKNKVDGTTILWSDVMMFETKNAYYLYVNA